MDELSICPVTGWNLGTLPDQCMMVRFEYIAHAMQKLDESAESPWFGMTAAQCRELGQRLLAVADKAEGRTDHGGAIQ